MGQIKWIKLFTGTYDDEKIKIIDSMDNRDVTHYVWIRLLIQAAKTNSGGLIFLDENMPFTKEILAILFNRPMDLIEDSLKILENLKMIDIDDNGVILIVNWDKHQNIEGMEKIREQTRERVNKYRSKNKERKKEDEKLEADSHIDDAISCNVTVTKQSKTESENEKEIENKTKSKTGLKLEEVSEAESNITAYIKKLNVKIRGSNPSSIKSAVITHGEENVKLAIDKALEVDRPRMNYIKGILSNWKIEGYPDSLTYRNPNNRKVLSFNNFEARKYDYEKLEKELLGW